MTRERDLSNAILGDAATDMPPLVTIGLPLYNSAQYVRQSLDSLLGQTYSDFVLLISDNASTDETAKICLEYAAADSRVKYFRNGTNIGNPGNFNRIARLTTTKYLKWSTGDDYWKPTFLERALEIMERDPSIALCYPQAVLVDAEGGNPTNYDDVLHLVQEDPVERFWGLLENIKLAHQHLGLIRMAFLKQTLLLGSHVGSDINLLAELTLYGKFYELPERLFFRRFHKESGSWNRTDSAHQTRRYLGAGSRDTLRLWRTHARFFAGVNRSPLSFRAKMRIYPHLTRRVIWTRDELAKELAQFTHLTR
jgi:glycosyltransferase involved in cell wall biosynthesis